MQPSISHVFSLSLTPTLALDGSAEGASKHQSSPHKIMPQDPNTMPQILKFAVDRQTLFAPLVIMIKPSAQQIITFDAPGALAGKYPYSSSFGRNVDDSHKMAI